MHMYIYCGGIIVHVVMARGLYERGSGSNGIPWCIYIFKTIPSYAFD